MKRSDHEERDSGEKKRKKKKKSRKHGETEEEQEGEHRKKKHHKKDVAEALTNGLKKALGPIPSIKTPGPLVESVVGPQLQTAPPMEWLREQEIFHNFTPQSVEAHIMFLHLATRSLCGEMNGLADGVTLPLRNYKSSAERIVAEAIESRRGLPEAERIVELLTLTKAMHTDMAVFAKSMDKCTRALLALHKSVQELATKSRARMRNITAHTFNSYIFSANTPGSSLLTVPTVPQ